MHNWQKFVSLITMLCPYTEQDQVDQRATSLDWIFTFLEQKYNLSNKGANFLKICNITYTPGTPHHAFYKELRSAINNSLSKKGTSSHIGTTWPLTKTNASYPPLKTSSSSEPYSSSTLACPAMSTRSSATSTRITAAWGTSNKRSLTRYRN